MIINTENLRSAIISISTSGDNTIVAAPTNPGNYLAIDFISILPTTANTVIFKSATTALSGAFPLDNKQAITWENSFMHTKGVITCAPNEAFVINLSGSTQVGGMVRYREVGN